MRIYRFHRPNSVNSSNAHLLVSEHDLQGSLNTLVDVGVDGFIIKEVDQVLEGLNNKQLDQIVLTHNHRDHAGGVMEFKNKYRAKVFAFVRSEGVDEVLHDGQWIRVADKMVQVIHSPGHSDDSICLYSLTDGVLFCGDAPIIVAAPGKAYPIEFICALERIADLNVTVIYSGHDEPVVENAAELIRMSLKNVIK